MAQMLRRPEKWTTVQLDYDGESIRFHIPPGATLTRDASDWKIVPGSDGTRQEQTNQLTITWKEIEEVPQGRSS